MTKTSDGTRTSTLGFGARPNLFPHICNDMNNILPDPLRTSWIDGNEKDQGSMIDSISHL